MVLDELLDRLYSASLDSFITERKLVVAALKAAGETEFAQETARLKKPNVVGWVVNRLALAPDVGLEGLVEAGEAQRLAQQEGDVAGIAAAGVQRRRVIEELMKRAGSELEESAHAPSLGTLQKIERTLETVAVHGRSGLLDPVPGRLERQLDPPGFEVLATLQKMPALASIQGGSRPKEKAKKKRGAAKVVTEATRKTMTIEKVSSPAADQERQSRARALATRRVMVEKRLQRAQAKDREEQESLREAHREARQARKQEEQLLQHLDRAKRTAERCRGRLSDQEERSAKSAARVAELKLELDELVD